MFRSEAAFVGLKPWSGYSCSERKTLDKNEAIPYAILNVMWSMLLGQGQPTTSLCPYCIPAAFSTIVLDRHDDHDPI